MLNEREFLCTLIDDPELMTQVDRNYLVSEEGQAIFETLKELFQHHVEPTVDHIVSEGNKRNGKITEPAIVSLLETPRTKTSFKYYFKRVRSDFAKGNIEGKLLKDIYAHTSVKGELNTTLLRQFSFEIQQNVELAEGREGLVKTPEQFMSIYLRTIEARNQGLYRWSFGDSSLDSALAVGPAPGEITSIFGATGSGKSTLVLNLLNRMINKRIPAGFFSLEMSDVATADRLMGLRHDLEFSQLLPKNSMDGLEPFVIDIIERDLETLKRFNSWFFVDEPSLSMADLETIIRQQQIVLGQQYMIIFVDLFSMLREVSGEDPAMIERGMNMIHEMARRLGVHFVLVIQANRATDSYRPLTLQGIQRLRPTLNNIKNSHAIAERSRVVLGVFREKYYADRFFPEDPDAQALDDIAEVQVLKQSAGKVGQIVRYLHHPGLFKFTKISDDLLPEMLARRRRLVGEEQEPARGREE